MRKFLLLFVATLSIVACDKNDEVLEPIAIEEIENVQVLGEDDSDLRFEKAPEGWVSPSASRLPSNFSRAVRTYTWSSAWDLQRELNGYGIHYADNPYGVEPVNLNGNSTSWLRGTLYIFERATGCRGQASKYAMIANDQGQFIYIIKGGYTLPADHPARTNWVGTTKYLAAAYLSPDQAQEVIRQNTLINSDITDNCVKFGSSAQARDFKQYTDNVNIDINGGVYNHLDQYHAGIEFPAYGKTYIAHKWREIGSNNADFTFYNRTYDRKIQLRATNSVFYVAPKSHRGATWNQDTPNSEIAGQSYVYIANNIDNAMMYYETGIRKVAATAAYVRREALRAGPGGKLLVEIGGSKKLLTVTGIAGQSAQLTVGIHGSLSSILIDPAGNIATWNPVTGARTQGSDLAAALSGLSPVLNSVDDVFTYLGAVGYDEIIDVTVEVATGDYRAVRIIPHDVDRFFEVRAGSGANGGSLHVTKFNTYTRFSAYRGLYSSAPGGYIAGVRYILFL